MKKERRQKKKKEVTHIHSAAIRKKQTIFLIAMLAIPVINWLVFWLYININSIFLAFQKAADSSFSLENFVQFFQSLTRPGNEMNIAVRNTLLYFLEGMLLNIPSALVISYFLYKRIRGYKFFRIIVYLPCILPPVVLTTVFKQVINPDGPLGVLVKNMGFDFPQAGLLGQASTATWTILVYTFLVGFGGNMLIFSGAMSRIPIEVIESARLDGVGPFHELTRIILPLIWPTITTAIVLQMTGLFTASGPILLLVNGTHETTTISYWIYNKINGDGYGGGGMYNLVSAAGLCFTAVAIPVILSVRKFMSRFEEVEY